MEITAEQTAHSPRFRQLLSRCWTSLYARRKLWIFGAIYTALSLFVMAHFLSSSLLGDRYYRTAYDAMYSGKAWKPFVYRVLIPKLTHSIVDVTPDYWKRKTHNQVRRWLASPDSLPLRKAMPWLGPVYGKSNIYPRLVTTALIYLSLWGYIILLFKLARALDPGNEAMRWLAPIFGMIAISSFSRPWQYIYDIPVLFLSAGCYYFLFTRQFKAYIFFFFLAALNRETAIFIFLFFTIWSYNRLSTPAFATLWVAQCVIYAAIKIILTFTYMENPGWFLENNFLRVLHQDLLAQASFYRITAIAVLFYLLTARWLRKPVFLKMSLWMLPVIYGAYLVHGNPGEYRVFFDLLPLLILLAAHTLTDATDIARTPFFLPADAEKEPAA